MKEKKHKQLEGMLFHLFDSTQSSPTPPPQKKVQLQQQQQNTLDVFTLSNRNPITGISFNLQAI